MYRSSSSRLRVILANASSSGFWNGIPWYSSSTFCEMHTANSSASVTGTHGSRSTFSVK